MPALPTARDLGLVPPAGARGSADEGAAAASCSLQPVIDAEFTPEPVPIPVLYEDDVLLVVDKPAGLATMPRGRFVARSVIAQLRWARGEHQLVAAHRLDRLTSGVLVLVKRPEWRGTVQSAFEHRVPGLAKEYRARTARTPEQSPLTAAAAPFTGPPRQIAPGESLTAELPMRKTRGIWQVQITPEGRPTRTQLTAVDATSAGQDWLLRPQSGYTHQLRVTLAALGYPMLGDPLYPRVTPAFLTDLPPATGPARLHLHASALALPPLAGPADVAAHGLGEAAGENGPRLRKWPRFEAQVPWE